MRTLTSRSCALGALLLYALALPSLAHAQGRGAFQAEHFEPLPSQGVNILNVGTSEVLPDMLPTVGVFSHYVNDPLVVRDPDNDDALVARPLAHQLKAELWGGVGLLDVAELGFVLPVVVYQQGEDLGVAGQARTIRSFAFADARIVPKLRLLDAQAYGGFGLAIMAPLHIPVGDDQSFNSDGGVKFEPRLVADWRSKRGLKFALNAGYQLRPESRTENIITDDVVRLGLGAQVPLGQSPLQLISTLSGNVQLERDREGDERFGNNYSSPLEAVLGGQYVGAAGLVANLGAGFGLSQGVGSPDFRVFASLGYTPRFVDADGDAIEDRLDTCPLDAEDLDGFEDEDGCPDPDNDKDGVLDASDRCPEDVEDIDNHEDADGCPDPDNDADGVMDVEDACPMEAGVPQKQGCPVLDADGDGILDEKDSCPQQPEDLDGFEDEDGCPDPDNDKDGLPDAQDACPMEAELFNGTDDTDGCPEKDTDGDGIIDPLDKCPDEAETYNGKDDEDGCPDGKARVTLINTEIRIYEEVFFVSGKATIQKRSFVLLDTVAAVLKQNPQVTRLRVEGHTDDVGKDSANLELSRARAAAVREHLIARGIDPERLTSQGYGEERPRCEQMATLLESKDRKAIKECRASNRRVELKVTQLGGKDIEASNEVTIQEEVIEQEAP